MTNTSSSISITIDHTFLLYEDTIDATKLSRSNNEILFDLAYHSTVSLATSHTTSHTANNDSNDDAASENELSTKSSETSSKAPTATITTLIKPTITTIESATIPFGKK
jgi:cytoskeletal protein RodZ